MSAYSDLILSHGPAAYWRLGESSGTTGANSVIDASGNGRHGTPSSVTFGSAGALTGDSDTAATFGGSGSRINLTSHMASAPATTATVSVWVRTSSPGASYRRLVVLNGKWGAYLKDGILIAYDMAAGQDRSSGVSIADGQWHHVAYVFQSGVSSGSRFYVDGVAVGSAITATAGGTTFDWTIGDEPNNGQGITGLMDDPAVFARALTAPEILAHYNAGIGLTSTYLLLMRRRRAG